jgi:hypothetical protein
MPSYITTFLNTLNKNKFHVQFSILVEEDTERVCKILNGSSILYTIPESIKLFYSSINTLEIHSNNSSFQLYPLEEVFIEHEKKDTVIFAQINNTPLCFVTNKVNEAGEWDIVNGLTGFVITKTVASFFTNKIWAWVNKGRQIWAVENYF